MSAEPVKQEKAEDRAELMWGENWRSVMKDTIKETFEAKRRMWAARDELAVAERDAERAAARADRCRADLATATSEYDDAGQFMRQMFGDFKKDWQEVSDDPTKLAP